MSDCLAGGPVIVCEVGGGEADALERIRVGQVEYGELGGLHGVRQEGRLEHNFGGRAEGFSCAAGFPGAGFSWGGEVDGGANATGVQASTVGSCPGSGEGVAAGAGVAAVDPGDGYPIEFIYSLDEVLV